MTLTQFYNLKYGDRLRYKGRMGYKFVRHYNTRFYLGLIQGRRGRLMDVTVEVVENLKKGWGKGAS